MLEDLKKNLTGPEMLSTKLELLRQIYETYEELAKGFLSACEKSCAACCTQNVICTSIEAEFLLKNAEMSKRASLGTDILRQISEDRLQPALTINSLAEYCLKAVEVLEIPQEVDHAACPLLEGARCSLYSGRPFACRAMWSEETCRPKGQAVMNPRLVSINGVFQQIIEDIDRGGLYGNMLDLVDYFGDLEKRETYLAGRTIEPQNRLLRNSPSPGFVVPPEHRPYVMKWLNRLWEKKVRGSSFREATLRLREMMVVKSTTGVT